MKKKNKLLWIVTILSITASLLLTIKVIASDKEIESKEIELVSEKGKYPEVYDYLNAITVQSFKDKVANKENFYLYMGRPTCGDCNNFEPDLIDLVKKHDLQNELIYLNVAELRTHDKDWNEFKEEHQLLYTPTLAKFENGELISKEEWTPEDGISIEKVEKWINENMKG